MPAATSSARRLVAVLAAAVTLAVPALLAAGGTAAYAAGGVAPTISAVGSQPGDPGLLTVSAASDSPVTRIAAHLVSVSHTPTVTRTVGAFGLTSGTTSEGSWQSSRVNLDLSRYTLTVTVTDQDGDSTTSTPQTLDYWLQPRGVGVSVSPTTLDRDHPTVTMTGTLDRFDPRTAAVTAWTHQPVAFSTPAPSTTTTDGQGRFTTSYAASGALVDGTTLDVRGTTTTGSAAVPVTEAFAQASVAVAVAATRVRLDPLPNVLDEGATLNLTGHVEALVGGAWTPLGSAAVLMTGLLPEGGLTDGSGAFRFPVVLTTPGTTVTVQLDRAATTGGALLTDSSASVALAPRARMSLTWDSFWTTERSAVHIGAQLSRATTGAAQGKTKVYLEQSKNGKSGWVSLGWLRTSSTGALAVDGVVAHPKGYWRLHYLGSATRQPAVSNVVHGSRRETRFTHLAVTPVTITQGHRVSVKGSLQRLVSAKWATFPKQAVYFYFRPKSSSTFHLMGTGPANAQGRFSKKFTAKKDGYWSVAWWTPNDKYVDAFSTQVLVDVK